MQRRTFIHHFGLSAVALGVGIPRLRSTADFSLTILHTNDLHGRFEKTTSFSAQASEMIRKARNTQQNVLLLDGGDVLNPSLSQGHELQWMKSMGYDAFAIGNHDFDRGMEDLARQIQQSQLTALAANYQCENTPLHGLIKPYRIFEKAGQRIGVIGLGVNPQGSIPLVLREGIVYQDALETANQLAATLKQVEGCTLVICLSHLGYHYKDQQISDLRLAAETRHIDLIIGGHTHTFLPEPVVVNNLDKKPVLINHAGWGGLLMGRMDVQCRGGVIHTVKAENIPVGSGELN